MVQQSAGAEVQGSRAVSLCSVPGEECAACEARCSGMPRLVASLPLCVLVTKLQQTAHALSARAGVIERAG